MDNMVASVLGRFRSNGKRHDTAPAVGDTTRLRASLLSQNQLFASLRREEVESLAARLPMATAYPGQVIYAPEETGEALFLLKKGRVRIYRLAQDGRKLVLMTIGAGTAFGEMPPLGQTMTGSFAEALDECVLCVMGRDDVESMLREHPSVAINFLQLLGSRLREAEDRIERITFNSVSARVAGLLLDLADETGEVEGYSHQDLAELLGIARETVSRTLVDFRSGGFVDIDRRCIHVRDPRALRGLARN